VKSDEQTISFDKPTRIAGRHIKDITARIDAALDSAKVISKDIVYYVADGDNASIDIRGVTASTVTAVYSLVGVADDFCSCVPTAAIARAGFRNIQYVPVPTAEIALIPMNIRDAGASLIRSDFFSTAISHIIGDGITYLTHFDMGVGYIINEIMDSFSVNYETASQLLKICAPTVRMPAGDNYIVGGKSFPASIVNNLVAKRIGEFGDKLKKVDMATEVYMSGGGLEQIYGAKNILSNAIDANINIAADNLTKQSGHPETTINALLRLITNTK
jgi:hypothetical protein